jgi:hypothetical protein
VKKSYLIFAFVEKKKKKRKSTVAFSVSCGMGARSHYTKIDTQKQKTLREEGKNRKKKRKGLFSFT